MPDGGQTHSLKDFSVGGAGMDSLDDVKAQVHFRKVPD